MSTKTEFFAPALVNSTRRRAVAGLVVAVASGIGGLTAGPAWANAQDDFLVAVKNDRVSQVLSMLLRGMDPNVIDEEGNPAIVLALREKAYQVADILTKAVGFKPDLPNRFGETALMYAAMQGRLDIAKTLKAEGAEVNRSGWTPLHYATTSNQVEMIKWLVEESAYLDAESPNQTTPLMMAARSKFRESCKVLIELGADPTYKNQAGLTAAAYADRASDRELADWLRRREDEFRKRWGMETGQTDVQPKHQ